MGKVFEVAVVWVGDLFRNARLLEKKKKKQTHSFSSNQGSVLKFENFAVIRRMNYFSVSLGFLLGAQAAECLRLCYLAGHPRGTGRQEGCLPGAGPCHTVPGMSITQRPAEP